MRYPINWMDDNEVRRLFTYQARIGAGPKAWTRPIAWYQAHHVNVHDLIRDALRDHGLDQAVVKCIKDRLYARTEKGLVMLTTIRWLWDMADNRCRA